MVKDFTTKYLIWMLAAWIGSWCMVMPVIGIAAERSPAGVTCVDYRTTDLTATVSTPDRRRNGDDEKILDNQEAVDSDAAAPTGLEDTQAVALAGDVPHQRIAGNGRVLSWFTASFVEPRFLRYGRLLN